MSNKNLRLLEVVVKLLASLGFSVRWVKTIRNDEPFYYIYIIKGAKEIFRFLQRIKPCIRNMMNFTPEKSIKGQILDTLSEKDSSAKEISKKLGKARSTIYKHLYELRDQGLVSSYKVFGKVFTRCWIKMWKLTISVASISL